jgi:indole-3-glycerol phosphate synthase
MFIIVKETIAQIKEMQEFGAVELSVLTDSRIFITRIAISAKSNILIVNIPYIFICIHTSEYL